MDALPTPGGQPGVVRFQNPGVMHACGHDGHMAMALGAGDINCGEKIPGTVRFLFQPSEEVADEEGLSGAPRMIQDGAMDGVEMVIATACRADHPCGCHPDRIPDQPREEWIPGLGRSLAKVGMVLTLTRRLIHSISPPMSSWH